MHVKYRLAVGELFCFETWGEGLIMDEERWLYAVVEDMAPYNDAFTQSDYTNYYLVSFRVIDCLDDVVVS